MKNLPLFLTGSALALMSGAVRAQTSPAGIAPPEDTSGGIPEIIVTAEKRELPLQKTPLAISAFSETFLKDSSVRDIQDVAQYAPGLTYTKVSNFVQLNVRGIGLEQINLGGEPGVALHIDGVYVGRPFVGDAIFSDLAPCRSVARATGNPLWSKCDRWVCQPDFQ